MLSELNTTKNHFLGMAAHDLRNPLSVITSFSDMLLDEFYGEVGVKQKEMLKLISETSMEMLTLVNNLLDVSVIESGNLSLNLSSDSLVSVLDRHIQISEMIAQRKNIQINFEKTEIPEFVFDKNKIGQIMDNLVSNAIKFSPEGSVVSVSAFERNEIAVISVKDEGPGINQEDHNRIFQEFEKTSNRPTGGETSTGLGLSIVKKIIDAHGGSISIKSGQGLGTEFIVKLPLKRF